MVFGRILSPVDPRHSETAVYIAEDWETLQQSGASIDMYVCRGETQPYFEEAPSESSPFGKQEVSPTGPADAVARVRDVLTRPARQADLREIVEAEGDSV